MASSMTEDSQYSSREEMMRSHHLWPWKSQNRTIPVNLEAIQTTMIASKLFQTLYLGYNQVLHYIVYGLQLSNFDISSASLDLSTIFKYILKKSNYLQLNPVQKQPQLQHVPSVSLVPSDGPKLNCTWSVSFDSVFSRYHSLFWSSVDFHTNFSSIMASRIFCSLIGLLKTTQHFPFGSLRHHYACD